MGDQQETVMGCPAEKQPLLPPINTPPPTTATTNTPDICNNGNNPGEDSSTKRWFGAVIILGYFFFMLWISGCIIGGLSPDLRFNVQSLTANHLIISSSSSSSSHISAFWDITFNISNPLVRGEIWFDGFRVSVIYKHAKISSEFVRSSFSLAALTSRTVRVGVSSKRIDGSVAEAIAADMSISGFVSVDVTVNATIKTSSLWSNDKVLKSMNVSCERMMVVYLPDFRMGSKVDGSRSCIVRLK